MLIEKLSPQINLRPAGVWDFVLRPDPTTDEGREDAKDFEQLWAMAEREAFAAGEMSGPSALAS